MAIVYVQFSDATETAISAVFACAQNPEERGNLGEIDDADPRYVAFMNHGDTTK